MPKRTHAALKQPTDLMIREAAVRLRRSYSWVYEKLTRLETSDCYRYKGVLFIRDRGFRKLTALSIEAPKRGRPRKVLSHS